jgi:hypothetical protein
VVVLPAPFGPIAEELARHHRQRQSVNRHMLAKALGNRGWRWKGAIRRAWTVPGLVGSVPIIGGSPP